MYLLAVSGGPDSMFLLNEYHRRDIVVAHVNYKSRKSSDRDEKIVREYCKYHGIKLEILIVKEKPKGNFESWARKVRYDFFKKVYDKYSCKALLTGHHRDDFLETALMQQRSKREPDFYGIKKKSQRDGMNILRPFIDIYYKEEILRDLDKKQIKYGIDETNQDDKFTRNKIRKEISSWDRKEKQSHISWFKTANKILKKKNNKVNSWYSIWENKKFSVEFFRNIKSYKKEVVFKYIHEIFGDVKLTSGKIESLIDFIEGKDGGKKFIINSSNSLKKAKGFLLKD